MATPYASSPWDALPRDPAPHTVQDLPLAQVRISFHPFAGLFLFPSMPFSTSHTETHPSYPSRAFFSPLACPACITFVSCHSQQMLAETHLHNPIKLLTCTSCFLPFSSCVSSTSDLVMFCIYFDPARHINSFWVLQCALRVCFLPDLFLFCRSRFPTLLMLMLMLMRVLVLILISFFQIFLLGFLWLPPVVLPRVHKYVPSHLADYLISFHSRQQHSPFY